MISKSENWSKESSPKLQQENSNPQDGGASPESSPNSQEQSMVLSRLFDASKYASDCGKNNWDFAIELSDFVQQGVSRSLLRWLVYRRYVEHRYEVRTRDGEGRLFREAPDSVLTDSSCFTIAEGGREALGRLRQDGLSKSSDESKPNAVLPVWCPVTRILKISGKVVKHFKWPAPNQEKLICAFAEQGWPVRLDDPLLFESQSSQ